MATVPVIPSGSTNGRPIKIAATSTPGTLLHTAVAGATSIDEVWFWITNNDVVSRNLTLELGGVTDPDDLVRLSVDARTGLFLVLPGARYNGGVALRAFCNVANVLCITPIVNRYTP